jgi:hypothetical protein
LIEASATIGAIKSEMAHAAQERADERILSNFHLGHETVRNAETHDERKHVDITGVICGVDFGAGRIHKFFADYPHMRTGEGEQKLERGGGETSGGVLVANALHDDPAGHNPKREYDAEINAVGDFCDAL